MPCPLVCFNVLQIEHSSTAIKVDIHAWLHVAQFEGGITCTSCSSFTTCHTKGHQHKIELDYQLTIISCEYYTLLEHMQSHRLQRVCKSMLGYYVPCMCPIACTPAHIYYAYIVQILQVFFIPRPPVGIAQPITTTVKIINRWYKSKLAHIMHA